MNRLAIGSILACVAVAGVVFYPSDLDDGPELMRTGPMDAADRKLQATLTELAGAWNPRKKRRAIAAAKTRVDILREPLRKLLERPRHPKLSHAMFLCAELRVQELRPQIVRLIEAAPRAQRPEAVMAAARLESWDASSLRELLASSDLGVRLAALWCWKEKPHAELYEVVLAMLGDRDPEIRAATLDALHASSSPALRKRILESARASSGHVRLAYIAALGRLGLDKDFELYLVECLWDEKAGVRIAALESLRHKKGKLEQSRPIIEAINSDVSTEESALALYCLERTDSFETSDILNRLVFVQAPLSKLFAARCLLQRGDKTGAELLVDVLAALPAGQSGDDAAVAVRAAAIEMLAQLTGRRGVATVDEWRAAVQKRKGVSPRRFSAMPAEQLRALGL